MVTGKVDGDELEAAVGNTAISALMRDDPRTFSDYYMAMDYACRCFLKRDENGASFIANIDHDFENLHFFSCSAQGNVQSGNMFDPQNVLPIVEWLMLRDDKEFQKAWADAITVPDVSREDREMYRTNGGLYDRYIDALQPIDDSASI